MLNIVNSLFAMNPRHAMRTVYRFYNFVFSCVSLTHTRVVITIIQCAMRRRKIGLIRFELIADYIRRNDIIYYVLVDVEKTSTVTLGANT